MIQGERLFKVLGEGRRPCHGGKGTWALPVGRRLGKWMPAIVGDLQPCIHGYHLCREQDLVAWLGPTIYLAEYRGERREADDKIVVREARLRVRLTTWNERVARRFAADCAERVLPVFEAICHNDRRPHEAIAIARQWADGAHS